MHITEFLINFCTEFIAKTGYAGITVLMAGESMILPIPSEAVMPFAGFLIFQGQLNLITAIIWSTVGSVIGSLLSYYIGKYGGKPFVKKYGKYLLLNEHHLDQTTKFFERYGDKTIFFSRFIPIVRHLISMPAGAGKMNLTKFTIYTLLGAGLWNAFLTYLGFVLGSKWTLIRKYSEVLDIILVLAVVAFAIYLYLKKRKKKPAIKQV